MSFQFGGGGGFQQKVDFKIENDIHYISVRDHI
jgi:hypothetical protein